MRLETWKTAKFVLNAFDWNEKLKIRIKICINCSGVNLALDFSFIFLLLAHSLYYQSTEHRNRKPGGQHALTASFKKLLAASPVGVVVLWNFVDETCIQSDDPLCVVLNNPPHLSGLIRGVRVVAPHVHTWQKTGVWVINIEMLPATTSIFLCLLE